MSRQKQRVIAIERSLQPFLPGSPDLQREPAVCPAGVSFGVFASCLPAPLSATMVEKQIGT
jgi:hypothetical protein